MNKYNYIFCLILLLITHTSANSQLLNIKIGSDALVEDAIKDAIILVESRYCIQDIESDQKYGRNGDSYFNKISFLGCKTEKGILTSSQAMKPWEVDKTYNKYRDNSKYRALLDSTLIIRSLPIDTTQSIDISSNLVFNNDSTLICIGIADNIKESMAFSTVDKGATNWIVWVLESTNENSKDSQLFEYNIVKRTIDFSKDKGSLDIPSSTNPVVGAIYLNANVVSVGLIEFCLSGFAIDKSGEWIIVPVDSNSFPTITDKEDDILLPYDKNDSNDSLTPIKEINKEKKKKPKTTKKK